MVTVVCRPRPRKHLLKRPPGVKGRRLRGSVENALTALANGESDKATEILREAKKRYDANEA